MEKRQEGGCLGLGGQGLGRWSCGASFWDDENVLNLTVVVQLCKYTENQQIYILNEWMVCCGNYSPMQLFKQECWERQRQTESQGRRRGGAGLRPGTPTTSMTWALHLDKSCRPRRARSKSSRYSSSDFWLSSPEPVTTWRTRAVTPTDTFIPYFTQKNTTREVLLLNPLDEETEA